MSAPVEVNELLRDVARRVAEDDRSEWEFLCECGQPGCVEHVSMPLALYDKALHECEAVAARGHLRARALAARRWSAKLRADAQAVRAQAQHQTKRARSRRAGYYALLIKGELSDEAGRAFGGMTLTRAAGRTMLRGFVHDEAQLRGLLKRVSDLELTLLSATVTGRTAG
jgi:hypothetical protein